MGLDVGIRFSPSEIEIKEHQAYKDISGIKISHDSHYCIVTLKDHVEFNEYVAPLCLPEMNKQEEWSDEREESGRGQRYKNWSLVNFVAMSLHCTVTWLIASIRQADAITIFILHTIISLGQGTILGFGYKEEFPDTMKSLANSKKLKERILAKHNYDFFNSTKCVEKFGTHMGRRRTWKSHKWVFKRKGFLHHGTQKSLRYV